MKYRNVDPEHLLNMMMVVGAALAILIIISAIYLWIIEPRWRAQDMKYSHENTPEGYDDCTREAGHEGPCALPLASPLKACPFCGNKASILQIESAGGGSRMVWIVGCTYEECEVEFPGYARKVDAVKAWNTRAYEI